MLIRKSKIKKIKAFARRILQSFQHDFEITDIPLQGMYLIHNNNNIFQRKMNFMQANNVRDELHDSILNHKYLEYPQFNLVNERTNSAFKTGHWSEKQNAKYYAFLVKFADKFSEKEARRHWKVFKSLADFIKTRNPNQCRSHHHKMKKNFGSIEETLQFLRNKQPGLQKRSQKYSKQLQTMDFSDFGNANNDLPANGQLQHQGYQVPMPWEMNPVPQEDFNFNYLNPQKKNDVANWKTGDYQQVQYNQPQENHDIFQDFNNPPDNGIGFGGFPSTGLLGSPGISDAANVPNFQNYQNEQNPFNFDFGAQNSGSPFQKNEREQKLQQCHYYFMQWISKLHELMGDQQKKDF